MTPETARAIHEAWRARAGHNRHAKAFAAILDAIDQADPEGLTAAVASIAAELPALYEETVELVTVTAGYIERDLDTDPPLGPELRTIRSRRTGPEPDSVIFDELLGWNGKTEEDPPNAS